MASKPLPSQRLLQKLFSYDPATGALYWRDRPKWMFFRGDPTNRDSAWKRWNTFYAGQLVGGTNGNGYRSTNIFGGYFMVHRLIWKLVYGRDPICIDHINRVRADNRLKNLRNIRSEENQYNQGVRSDNTSGVPGVYWLPKRREWKAEITFARQKRTIGYYKTKEEAVSARRLAEVEVGFHPTSL